MSNAFASHNSRRAFICGFTPGHLVHPHQLITALKSSSSIQARILSVSDDGTIELGSSDGSITTVWNHDPERARSLSGAEETPLVSLVGDSLLAIGDGCLSVSKIPTQCWGVHASDNSQHPAWVGLESHQWVPDPESYYPSDGKIAPPFCGCAPGHRVSLKRLDRALKAGPGQRGDVLEITDAGRVVLGLGGREVVLHNHNPKRMSTALQTYRNPLDREYPLDYGDHPEASLLDRDVLRIGHFYFWTTYEPRALCSYDYTEEHYEGMRRVLSRNGARPPKYPSQEDLSIPGFIYEMVRSGVEEERFRLSTSLQEEQSVGGTYIPIGLQPSSPEWGSEEHVERIYKALVSSLSKTEEQPKYELTPDQVAEKFITSLYGETR
ncbi:unannotated protein [freshwater metagenome]|uniref:Unannotated protein n=1 Tax=freshwater metagenome TaxID=449393 RepID=A0A6J6MID6_9ZZZZ